MSDEKNEYHDYHKIHLNNVIETFKPIFIFASEAIKNLQLCHGGALTAVLAFHGISKQNSNQSSFDLLPAFICFSLGLFLTTIIFISAYFSQMCYKKSIELNELIYDVPYVVENKESQFYNRVGNLFRAVGIIGAIVSCVLFLSGISNLKNIFY